MEGEGHFESLWQGLSASLGLAFRKEGVIEFCRGFSGGIYHLFTLQPLPSARLASGCLSLLKDFSWMLKSHHSFTRDLLCAILYFKYWAYKDEKDMTPLLSHVTVYEGEQIWESIISTCLM